MWVRAVGVLALGGFTVVASACQELGGGVTEVQLVRVRGCDTGPPSETPPSQPGAPPDAGCRPVASVEVTPSESVIGVGNTVPLEATLRDRNEREITNRSVNWSSSNENAATVDENGLVLGMGEGLATISAESEEQVGTAMVTVIALPEILFRSDRDGVTEVYGVNANGSGLVRLTDGSELKQNPVWSPDRQKILFTKAAAVNGINQSMYVVDAIEAVLDPDAAHHEDMSVSKNSCLPSRNNTCVDGQQHWSPDGRQIIFSSNRDGADLPSQAHPELDVYLMDVETKLILRRWINSTGEEASPGISPAAPNMLLFSGYRTALGGDPFDLYLMEMDEEVTDAVNLTQPAGFVDARDGRWSPDGTRIVFTGFTHSTREDVWVYTIATAAFAGLNTRRHGFDDLAGGGGGIGWSPDGDRLVIAARRNGNWDCFIVDSANGDLLTRVTAHPANDLQCSWFN